VTSPHRVLGPSVDADLLDQRGSGMSSPNLDDCLTDGKFPPDAFASQQKFIHALAHATGNCSWYWRAKGVDVTGYNTEENADDVEDLRQALGATKISFLGHSIGDYSLLQQQVEALYNDFDSGITLMGRTMDCSAGTPLWRLLQTESEARTSLFSNVSRIDMRPEVCKEALGNFALGPEYFAPLYSPVLTLFLSGTLDADTPPMKAERMRWGFPRSTHIVVENGFHETLPAADVQALVVDFFKGQDVTDRHIVFETPRFLSLDDAKRSKGRRPLN